MARVTITGVLATDEAPTRTLTSSFTLDVDDFTDTEQPITTAYELITGTDDGPTTKFWTVLHNTGDNEAVIRINIDSTNYVFLPLLVGGVMIVPSSVGTATAAASFPVGQIHLRTLTGTTTVRAITLFVS